MGIVLTRFRRKKTTLDILDKLDKDIRNLEDYGVSTERKHKRVIGYVMAFSVGLYVLFTIMYYFMYVGKSKNFAEKIMYASPLLLLPVLVIFIRSAISWFFNWSIGRNRTRLSKMRDQKRQVLEEVMNTEKYKVAKEILDKYGNPEQTKSLKPFVPTTNVLGNETLSPIPATPGQLRQRQLMSAQNASTPLTHRNDNNGRLALASQLNKTPYPILDTNGSVLGKVVDYLVKDGPNYRMALICSHCHKHNGMCLFEEFEYASYECCFCHRVTQARRRRPPAPQLAISQLGGSQTPGGPVVPQAGVTFAPTRGVSHVGGGDESSSDSSSSDSENDSKPNVIQTKASDHDSGTEETPKTDEEKKCD